MMQERHHAERPRATWPEFEAVPDNVLSHEPQSPRRRLPPEMKLPRDRYLLVPRVFFVVGAIDDYPAAPR